MRLCKIFVLTFVLLIAVKGQYDKLKIPLQSTESRNNIEKNMLDGRQEELNLPLQSTESGYNAEKGILDGRREKLNLPLPSTERRYNVEKDILDGRHEKLNLPLQSAEHRYNFKKDILKEIQDELHLLLQSTERILDDEKYILEGRQDEELNLPLQFTERRIDAEKDILEQIILKYLFEAVRTGYFTTPWGLRRVHKEVTTNPDGSRTINVKVVLAKTLHNTISLIGSISNSANETDYNAASSGVMLENDKGITLNFIGIRNPEVGNQIMAAVKVNIFQDKLNKIDGTAFISRTKSNNSVPNHTTAGGSLDYTFGNRISASLGISHTPELHRTEITSKGNVNIIHNDSSSVNLGGGMSMSVSPEKPTLKPTRIGISVTKFS